MGMEQSLCDNSRIRVSEYYRIILDESKRKFGNLGTKVDGLRRVAFSLVDDFPLELGKAR